MNKKLSYYFAFTIALSFCIQCSFAQNKLLLCTGYDKDGKYSGAYNEWNIQKDGNFMYLFYESATPLNDTLLVIIDKVFNRTDTNFYEFDHYYLVPDISKKWAVNKYIFSKSGKYKITVFDRNNNQLAQPYITNIDFNVNEYNEMKFVDTWYYNQSETGFYENNKGDTMVGRNDVFSYKQDGTRVILYIGQKDKRPLKTPHLISRIYTNDTCHEFIRSNSYYVDENWSWTFVPVYFYKKGKYTVELYNDDDIFINSTPIEIK
jgi:hypothetical protein